MITDEVNIDREVEEHLGHLKMHCKSGKVFHRHSSLTPHLVGRAWPQPSGSYEKKGSCSAHECPSEPIAGLTVKQVCIGACRQTFGCWRKLTIAVQSGSLWSVIDAFEENRGCEDNDTPASKKALTYAAASGVEIPTLGEEVVPMHTKSMKLQAATVTRPVASVNRIWWCLIRSAA